jgi:hypothetical protein
MPVAGGLTVSYWHVTGSSAPSVLRQDGPPVLPSRPSRAFGAQRRADEARGEWIDPRIGRTPFCEYAPVWMKSRLHKTGTADTYQGHLVNQIIPAFGAFGIAAIRPTMVQ